MYPETVVILLYQCYHFCRIYKAERNQSVEHMM